MEEKKKPTFVIKISQCQNASWQGTIRWLEKDEEKSFRSTLELIRLMDSAVGQEPGAQWASE